jgi:hypothetical protein
MQIIANGTLARGVEGTDHAMLTFGQVVALPNGALLALYRAGSTKDSADEGIEFVRSTDGGQSWGVPWRPFGEIYVGGKFGTLKLCYLTELTPGRLLAATMWIDRTSYPGQTTRGKAGAPGAISPCPRRSARPA